MTEVEAKKKWCPMVRSDWHGASTNRGDIGSIDTCTCLGRGCMMWRWSYQPQIPETDGYCGLGGRP